MNLPPEMGLMTKLDGLVVDGNPLKSIRRDVISKGAKPLLAFLRLIYFNIFICCYFYLLLFCFCNWVPLPKSARFAVAWFQRVPNNFWRFYDKILLVFFFLFYILSVMFLVVLFYLYVAIFLYIYFCYFIGMKCPDYQHFRIVNLYLIINTEIFFPEINVLLINTGHACQKRRPPILPLSPPPPSLPLPLPLSLATRAPKALSIFRTENSSKFRRTLSTFPIWQPSSSRKTKSKRFPIRSRNSQIRCSSWIYLGIRFRVCPQSWLLAPS